MYNVTACNSIFINQNGGAAYFKKPHQQPATTGTGWEMRRVSSWRAELGAHSGEKKHGSK